MSNVIDPFEEYLRKKKVELLERKMREQGGSAPVQVAESAPDDPGKLVNPEDPGKDGELDHEMDDFFKTGGAAGARFFNEVATIEEDKVEEIKGALDDVFEEDAPAPHKAEGGDNFVSFFQQVQSEFDGAPGQTRAAPAAGASVQESAGGGGTAGLLGSESSDPTDVPPLAPLTKPSDPETETETENVTGGTGTTPATGTIGATGATRGATSPAVTDSLAPAIAAALATPTTPTVSDSMPATAAAAAEARAPGAGAASDVAFDAMPEVSAGTGLGLDEDSEDDDTLSTLRKQSRLCLTEILLGSSSQADTAQQIEVLCRLVDRLVERAALPESEIIEALIKADVEF